MKRVRHILAIVAGLSVAWIVLLAVLTATFRFDHTQTSAAASWALGTALPAIAGLATYCMCRPRKDMPATGEAICPTCDYDLRATPGRCPECGTLRAR
jgi:hypothetical protein